MTKVQQHRRHKVRDGTRETADAREDLDGVVGGEDMMTVDLEDGKGSVEQHDHSLEEEAVQDPQTHLPGKGVDVQTHEP